MQGWMDVAVKCQINTHWELLALSSRLAGFTRGTTFSRLLLCHEVHVQYCAFTLSEKKTQQKNTSCTPRFDSCNPVITGVTVPLSPGVSSSRWQAWMNRRHRIFPGYERLYLCVQWAKWRFHLTKDAPGMIPDLLDTQKNHTTMKHLNVSGGWGRSSSVFSVSGQWDR